MISLNKINNYKRKSRKELRSCKWLSKEKLRDRVVNDFDFKIHELSITRFIFCVI